ncbi:VOC family protein [Roseivivax sp.]
MLSLDHIAVLGETLEAAHAHAEAALGEPLGPGGAHAAFATHNRLLGLEEGLYLEAIAADPEAPPPGRARWFGLDAFAGPPRLDKWICRVPDMDAALAAFPEAGRPVPITRGDLHWIMAVPEDGMLPYDGLFPAFIEWKSPVPAGDRLTSSGWRLTELVIAHPDAEALAARLAGVLDSPLPRFTPAAQAGLSARLERSGVTRWLS